MTAGHAAAGPDTDLIVAAASPELYRVNAFRVMGVLVDATPQEVRRRMREISIRETLGETAGALAGSILPLSPPSDGHAFRDASQRLRDPTVRLVDELFWFWPLDGTSRADEALEALAKQDVERAAAIWREREQQGSESMVSTHNLAVLSHALALDLEWDGRRGTLPASQRDGKQYYWRVAYSKWRHCLEQEGFWRRLSRRTRELDDPRLTSGIARRFRADLPLALLSVNATLALNAAERGDEAETRHQLQVISDSGFDSALQQEALRRVATPLRSRVKLIAANAEREIKDNARQAHPVAMALLRDARPILNVISCLLGKDHSVYQAACDEVAVSVLHAEVAYCGETSAWRDAIGALEQALEIGGSDSMNQRISENLRNVRSNLEGDTCWFCGKAPNDLSAMIKRSMHGNVVHTPTWEGTQITWQHTVVKIPRCQACKAAHDHIGLWQALGCFGGGLVGLLPLGILVGLSGGAGAAWVVGIILTLAGIGVGVHLGESHAKQRYPANIKPESTTDEFPAIKRLQGDGWQFGERPST